MQRQAPISTRGQPSAVGAGLCNPPHPGRAGSRRAHRTPGRRLPHRLRRRLCDAEGADAFGGRGAAARCALPGRCGVAAGEPWIPVPLSRRLGQRAAGGVRCLSEEGTGGRGSMCSGGVGGSGGHLVFFLWLPALWPCVISPAPRARGQVARRRRSPRHGFCLQRSPCADAHLRIATPREGRDTQHTHRGHKWGGGLGSFSLW